MSRKDVYTLVLTSKILMFELQNIFPEIYQKYRSLWVAIVYGNTKQLNPGLFYFRLWLLRNIDRLYWWDKHLSIIDNPSETAPQNVIMLVSVCDGSNLTNTYVASNIICSHHKFIIQAISTSSKVHWLQLRTIWIKIENTAYC